MAKQSWTHESTENLIQLYKQRAALWETQNDGMYSICKCRSIFVFGSYKLKCFES